MHAARIALALAIGSLALLSLAAATEIAGGESARSLGLGMLGFELFVGLGALAIGVLVSADPISRLGLRPGRLTAGAVALLALGTLGLSHGLDTAIELTGLREESVLGELDDRIAGARGSALFALILGVGIAPGIAEEILCRGLLQRGLQRRFGAPLAILASALLFGAIHVDPVQGTAAAALGLYLGFIAYRADGIRAPIACHTVNNLTALGLLVSGVEPPLPDSVSIVGGILLAAWALRAALQPGRRPDDG